MGLAWVFCATIAVPAGAQGRGPAPPAGGRPPPAAGAGARPPPGTTPAAPVPGLAAAAEVVPVGIVAWLGPLPLLDPSQARRLAAEALARIDLPAVDDGDALRIAHSCEVARRFVYRDGRVVAGGTVKVVREWAAKVVDAGTIGGKPWIALALERVAGGPPEPSPPVPAGAVEHRDLPPNPAFDSASLWLMQRADVDKDQACNNLAGLRAEIRPSAQAQCDTAWLGAPGSLADPELFAIGDEVRTGFFAAQAGIAVPQSATGLWGLAQLQWFRTSRQSQFITSSRAELGASYRTGVELAGHFLFGLQAGGDRGGLAVLGGVGFSLISGNRVASGAEAVGRAQARVRTGEGELLAWFEPAWIAGTGRAKGSPTLPWADGLRAGLYYGRDGTGVHATGLGVELWEVQGVRVVQVMVGLFSVFGKW